MNQSPIHRQPNKKHQQEQLEQLANPMVEHAVLVTVVQLVHLAQWAVTEVMAVTVNLVNRENVVTQLHLNQQSSTSTPNNAHAKLHQANKDQPDLKAPMDHQEMQVNQVPTARLETKDHEDHQVKQANKEILGLKVHQEKLAKPRRNLALLVLQEAQAKLAVQVQQAQPEVQAKMVPQAVQVVQEMQAHQEELANQAHQVQMANRAKLETQEAAPTAHQLVWLQDIKHPEDLFSCLHRKHQRQILNAFISFLFHFLLKFFVPKSLQTIIHLLNMIDIMGPLILVLVTN